MNYGFVKVAAAVPAVKVAHCKYNAAQIEKEIIIADGKGVQIIAFPELCITGYTCADLFQQQLLLEEAEISLMQVMNNTRQLDIIAILGMPIALNGRLLNAAVVIQKGKILGVVPKTYLPNYKEFYEQRWFTSAADISETSLRLCGQTAPLGANLLFETADTTFAIEICEDLWAPIPPSSTLALQGAEILFNLSADNESIGKQPDTSSALAALASQPPTLSLPATDLSTKTAPCWPPANVSPWRNKWSSAKLTWNACATSAARTPPLLPAATTALPRSPGA